MVPHDYATSSLPCAAFVWTVENVSAEPLDVSLMFTFQVRQAHTPCLSVVPTLPHALLASSS